MIRVAFAVLATVTLVGADVATAACPDIQPKKHQSKKQPPSGNCFNLNAVPQISAGVVAAEPLPPHKAPTYSDPTPAAYEGPTLGLTKPDPGVRAVPTVGYKWSLQ